MTNFEYFKSLITPEWIADNAFCTFASGSDHRRDCDDCPLILEPFCTAFQFRMDYLKKEHEEGTNNDS